MLKIVYRACGGGGGGNWVGGGGNSGSWSTPLCPGYKAYVNVKPLADSYLPWQKYTLHGSKI